MESEWGQYNFDEAHRKVPLKYEETRCRVKLKGVELGSRYKLTAGDFKQKLIKKGELPNVLNIKRCFFHLKASNQIGRVKD